MLRAVALGGSWVVIVGLTVSAQPSRPATETRSREARSRVDIGEVAVSRRSMLQLQVLLDRARFSPGEIDGKRGTNTQRALAAFQAAQGLRPAGGADEPTWQALERDGNAVLVRYRLAEEDVAGPFVSIPEDMMEKSKLERLGHSSALEGLAEKFHSSPSLLQSLNPGSRFDRAGEEMQVPNLGRAPLPKAAAVVVDRSELSVTAADAEGKTIARYPATMGSEHDPLPIGKWKVRGVQRFPKFYYNPQLFWDAEPNHAKATIAPGPNNPVGVVWIDLSKEHYGIHGTPEPASIGKSQSHGCIRLTNWDVSELADLVAPGLPAVLQE